MNESLKILVVDDNLDMADNLRDILDKKGYATWIAADGKSATDLCRQEPFDLVLLDYKLPDMNGLELQERLSEFIYADYIIITGHASIESAAQAVQRQQIVGYETKPLNISRLLAFIRQIDERRKAEEKIAQQSLHLSLAQEMARIGYWQFDIATRMPSWSDMMFTIFGLDPAKGVPAYEEHRNFIHPDDWERFDQAVQGAINGTSYALEIGIIFPDQPLHYIATRGHPQFDSDGNITSLFGISQDITDRKLSEEKIRTALAEKEILLRELHHRTKNNIQVISSMISLQKAFIRDKEVGLILKELEHKIQSMGLVHQKLYQSKHLTKIDLQEYIQELADLLIQSYGVMPDAVTCQLDMESISVLIDTAIPCGLVLNELISNGLKHAFSDQREGAIQIKLSHSDAGEINLTYSDNGPGMPDDFDFRTRKTLGLQTIFMIVEHQLRGTVEFDGRNGLSCRIRFKDTHYKERI